MEPLILTLGLDEVSQAIFEEARRRWFPPAINFISAHVTLFHHLPGAKSASVLEDLMALCAGDRPLPFTAAAIRFLGRGVAYSLHAPQAAALREGLAALWHDDLTPQDRQPWRPHVTVQNKVGPPQARALYDQLRQDFTPFDGMVTGLHLWTYLGGPWESLAVIPFAGGPPTIAL